METESVLCPRENQAPGSRTQFARLLAAGALWLFILFATSVILPKFSALFSELGAPVPYLFYAVHFLASFPGFLVQMFVGAMVVIAYCVVARSPKAAGIFTRILIYGQLLIVLGIMCVLVSALSGLLAPVK